jgi:superfamily II DNA or RNA helicase
MITRRDKPAETETPSRLRLVGAGSSLASRATERYEMKRRLGKPRIDRPSLWLARDRRLEVDVVVKQFSADDRCVFERDVAYLRAGLRCAPTLIDAIDTPDGGGWLARAYIPGESIEPTKPLPLRSALRLSAHLTRLLFDAQTARPQGVIFNSFRLGSVIHDASNRLWIVDGEDAQPAPDAEGDEMASSVFAAGVAVALLIAGRSVNPSRAEWTRILDSLPAAVRTVIERATATAADERYGSLKWLALALEELASAPNLGESSEIRPAPEMVMRPVESSEHPIGFALRNGQYASLESTRLAHQALFLNSPQSDGLQAADTLDIEPFAHQRDTVLRVLQSPGMSGGAILADEVGLGKTIEALMIAQELRARGLAKSILIVAPPAGAPQWLAEARSRIRRSATECGFRLYNSARDAGYPMLIVSSAMLKQERHFAPLSERAYDLVIVDEAHRCCAAGGSLSALGRAIETLSRKRLLLLTATPVGNRLWDLFTLTDLMRPGLLGTAKSFEKTFLLSRVAGAVKGLRARAKTVIVRHKRAELRDAVRPEVEFQTLLVDSDDPAARIDAAADLLCDEWSGHRAVVFARPPGSREALARELRRRDAERPVIVFKADSREHQAQARQFADHPASIILSGDTMSEGMNWQAASRLLHFDIPLTPLIWEQRIGRIYRLDQHAERLEIVQLSGPTLGEALALRCYEQCLRLHDLPIGEAASVLDHLENQGLRHLETPMRSLLRGQLPTAEPLLEAMAAARARYDQAVQEAAWLDALAFGDGGDDL